MKRKCYEIVILLILFLFFKVISFNEPIEAQEETITSSSEIQSPLTTTTTYSLSESTSEQNTSSIDENEIKPKENVKTSDSKESSSVVSKESKAIVALANPVEITSEQDLIDNLTSTTAGSYILTQNIPLTKAITIPANKELDLNQHTITATTASSATTSGKLIVNSAAVTSVIIKNGSITGGDSRGMGNSSSNTGVSGPGFFLATNTSTNLVATFENLSHTSTGGFFFGRRSKAIFNGTVSLTNDQFNVSALNMDFNGIFNGYTSANGNPGDRARSNGGINLSFDGYRDVSGTNTRILNVNENAQVILKNDNNTTGSNRAYSNNVGNFAQINVKQNAVFDATAIGTSLRTTASQVAGSSGTPSDFAEINADPQSTFKIATTARTNVGRGTIYTYATNINIDTPKVFDIRFFGNGVFFYSYNNRGGSNLNIKNSNLAVWDKISLGIGNPIEIWENVNFVNVANFYSSNKGTITSNPTSIASQFDINSYSRISNDIDLPKLIMDSAFYQTNGIYDVINTYSQVNGSSIYYTPDGDISGSKVVDGTVTMIIGSKTFTTTTDKNGLWSFSNAEVDFSQFPNGTSGTIRVTDSDERVSAIIPIRMIDNPLTAQASDTAPSFTVGERLADFSQETLKNWVKDVQIAGSAVTDYQVQLNDSIDTSTVTTSSTRNATVTVTATQEGRQYSADIVIPYSVTWGNTTVLGGSGTNVLNKESTMAITIHEDSDGNPYLSSSYGNITNTQKSTALNSSAPNDPLYQITYYDMSEQATGQVNAKAVSDGPNSENDVTFQALGSQTPAQVINQWGTEGVLKVNYGDVIKFYVKNQSYRGLFQNGQGPIRPIEGLPRDSTIFAVITPDGYQPLFFDHLDTIDKSLLVSDTASESAYDQTYQQLSDYFDVTNSTISQEYLDNIKVNGFVTYPKLNLSVGESSSGVISVATATNPDATAANQKFLRYPYSITVIATGPDLNITSITPTLNFTNATIQSYTQTLSREDTGWNMVVEDNRSEKSPWLIQAKVSEPFQTGIPGSVKELRGATLQVKQGAATQSLNDSFMTIYTKENPEVENTISWDQSNGFFLKVPPGAIDKNAQYSTTVDFILTNAPEE
ncbi:hypothetical protein ACYSNW_04070 [Enterococcus sp. LJL99]